MITTTSLRGVASAAVFSLLAWTWTFGPMLLAAPADAGPAITPPSASSSPRLPELGGHSGYTNSASCRECHRDQHDSWFASYHRSMTQVASTNSVVADFDDVRLEFNGERFTMRHRGHQYWVEVEDLASLGGSSKPVTFPIELVTGSHHMQVFWLPAGAGNAQIGFPFTWLIQERRWVPRDSTFIRDPHSPQQIETWNMTCIRCHVTGGQPRPRKDQGIFATRASELGIACDACHGPSEAHVVYRRRSAASGTPAPPSRSPGPPAGLRARNTNDPIVLPTRLDHVRASHVCAQCHGMRWFDTSENWAENGFRYRPGDDLEATTPIIRPAVASQQPWMKRVLERSPNLLSEFFWSDGMIRVAGREFNGLLESACYQKGKLSCTSCHALHEYADRNDQLRPGHDGNRACVSCHSDARYGPSHTHHAQDSSGSVCYNCHMPHTTYALLGGIRQHQIDSPRISAVLGTGRPDACTLCHIDRSLAWAAGYLTAWYGHPKADGPSLHPEVSAVARLALTGDAGQRALAAWHLGWEPARRLGGDDWQGPLLARLLEDPYPAVRRIAARSLRSLHGFDTLPADTLGTPAALHEASVHVLSLWKPTSTPRPAAERRALLLLEDGSSDGRAVDALLRLRDNRPMRLRE